MGPLSDQQVPILAKYVVIVGHTVDVHESLYEDIVEENENSEGSDPGNRAVEFVSEVSFHVFDFLEIYTFSFGRFGNPFTHAAALGSLFETRSLPVLRCGVPFDERACEYPMEPEVRIPPNG